MSKTAAHSRASPDGRSLSAETFAAIGRVDRLERTTSSRDRLEGLLVNPTLSPPQRRTDVLEFLKELVDKKEEHGAAADADAG